MKCNRCKYKTWNECCDDCKEKKYSCYKCSDVVKVKENIEHLSKRYDNPDFYLICIIRKVYKHISYFRFRSAK